MTRESVSRKDLFIRDQTPMPCGRRRCAGHALLILIQKADPWADRFRRARIELPETCPFAFWPSTLDPRPPMRAEIISIGDELTSGQRLDTNSQWLSERLVELGVDVMFHTTVGDDLEANVAVFRTAIDRADVVISTGGLGPTADDLTREAIAVATGVDLVQDDASLAHIRALFARRRPG